MQIELTAFPYDSEVIRYESDGMPVYDRAITSKEYRNLFLKYFTEGVFPNPSDNFQIVENSSQGALVKKGYANVRGVLIELKQDTPITFEQADSLDRIDRVVLRHNDTKSVRYADVVILKGSPSNSPQAPNITRDETIWDIVLADVRIRKNSSNVTQAQITDRRLDSELCGIVAGTIKEVDTTTLYNQIQSDLSQFKENEQAEFLEWFEKIKGQLGEDQAGNLQLQVNELDARTDTLEEAMYTGDIIQTGSQYSGGASDYGIEVLRIEGAYKQDGTPSPEAPIEPQFFQATAFNTNGGNLFDASKLPTKSQGGATVTNNGDGSFTVTGSGDLTSIFSQKYVYPKEEAVKLLKVGTLYGKAEYKTTPFYTFGIYNSNGEQVKAINNGDAETGSIDITNDDISKIKDGTYTLRVFIYGNIRAIKTGTIKPMVYQDGDGTFYPFNASSTPVDIELKALPNGVKDIYENGVITRNVGYIEFDGSDDETWEQFSVQYSIAISNMKIITGNPTNKTVISNRFDTTIQTSLPLGTIRQAGNTNKVHINYDNGTGGIQQFKDFLKSHPIKVWYELATPTTKQYTIPTLTSYYPFTNAWCDSELETSITWNALTGKSSILDGQGNVISKGYMSPQDNFLANSDFASGIINQKGQTTYTANGIYTIDMWRLVGSGSFGGKVTVGTNDILIENNGTEDVFFVNKTDLSYLIDRDYLIYVNAIGLGNNNAYVYCDAESGKVGRTQLTQGENFIKINGKPTTLGFELASTTRLRINKVKLEKGSRFTGMKPWNKGIEFAKCINKYRFELNNYYPIYEITRNKAIIPINHNGMDKKPSVIVYGGFCKGADGLTATFTSYKVVENKDNSTTVEVTFNKNIQGTSACLNVIIDSYDY